MRCGSLGAARGPLSVCRWRETGSAARPDDGAGGAAGLVLEVPRRGRGARRARPDPPRASAHPAGPDPTGRGGAGDHHDRCDGDHAGGRYGRGGADEPGRGAPRGVRRLRPLAAGAVSRLVSPVGAPAGQLISMRRRVTMLIKILIALAVVVAVFLAIVATRPAEYRVARTATISAPAPAVFAQVNDFHKWEAWSPWAKLDPAMKQTYEGAPAGTGAIYAWAGNNEVGEGRMTLTESRPSDLIRIRLEFLKPFAATSTAEFAFKPEGNRTVVTWSMAGNVNFVAKIVHLFMDMDRMIGDKFEQGLARLKSITEAGQSTARSQG